MSCCFSAHLGKITRNREQSLECEWARQKIRDLLIISWVFEFSWILKIRINLWLVSKWQLTHDIPTPDINNFAGRKATTNTIGNWHGSCLAKAWYINIPLWFNFSINASAAYRIASQRTYTVQYNSSLFSEHIRYSITLVSTALYRNIKRCVRFCAVRLCRITVCGGRLYRSTHTRSRGAWRVFP